MDFQLKERLQDMFPTQDLDPAVRQYFFVERHNFQKAHDKIQKLGIPVSNIVGSAFHFYDPDGNRINVFG